MYHTLSFNHFVVRDIAFMTHSYMEPNQSNAIASESGEAVNTQPTAAGDAYYVDVLEL